MKKIDISTWKRRNHYLFYKNFTDPCFNLCLNLDVSQAVNYAKKHNLSVFLTLLFLSNKATNEVPAFRRRLDNELNVWEVDCIQPSATVLKADETFNFCDFKFIDDLYTFVKQGKQTMGNALDEPGLANVTNEMDQIFYSVIPWLTFTSYKHASNAGFSHIPKIVFGKITPTSTVDLNKEQLIMPVSVELSHVLADGLDIAKYIAAFEQQIQGLC